MAEEKRAAALGVREGWKAEKITVGWGAKMLDGVKNIESTLSEEEAF